MTDPRMASPATRSGSQRAVAALVVALALATGLVAGVAVDRGLLLHGHPFGGRGWMVRGPRDHGLGAERVRKGFASELGLTPAQVVQVDSIMARHMTERRALMDSMGTRMRVLLDSTRADVDRILTPEQRQKFAALRARRDSVMARRGRRFGPSGAPPPEGEPAGPRRAGERGPGT